MKAYIFGHKATSFSQSTGNTNYAPLETMLATGSITTEASVSQVIPHDLTLSSLRVEVGTAPGSGKSWTFTLMKNGSATSLQAVISDTNTAASDTSNTVSLTAGDTVSLRCVPSGTPSIGNHVWWSVQQEASGKMAVLSGTNSSTFSAATFIPPHGASSTNSSESAVLTPVPVAGTISNLYVYADGSPGTGNSFIFKVRKNLADSGISATISNNSTAASDTTNTTSIAAGNRISISLTVSGTPTARRIACSFTWVPDSDGNALILGGSTSAASASATSHNFPLGGDSWNATEATRQLSMRDMTVKGMYVELGGTPGVGKSYALTFRNNSSSSSLTLTISDTSTNGSVASDTSVVDGDKAAVQVVPSGTPTNRFIKPSLYYTVGSSSQSITLPLIASTNTLTAPILSTGAVSLLLPQISSTTSLNSPEITTSAVSVSLPTIDAASTINPPSVSVSAVNISLPTINNEEVLYTISLTTGSVDLLLPIIESVVQMYNSTVTTGGVTVDLPVILSGTVLYEPTIGAPVIFEDYPIKLKPRLYNFPSRTTGLRQHTYRGSKPIKKPKINR